MILKKQMKKPHIVLCMALAIAAFESGAGQAQTVLDPAWRVTNVDTSKPGFTFSIFANSDRSTRPNNNATTENDLILGAVDGAGVPLANLADNTASGPAIGPAAVANPSNAPINFEITTVINMALTSPQGTFGSDDLPPGLPASSGNNGFSTETLSYLTLPVGTIVMGVQSDDSFGVQVGANPKDALSRVTVKSGEGGSQPQTLFSVQVTQAGTYPFRTIWQNGGGGAHLEWFSQVVSGGVTNNVLINDLANGGIPAYRALSNSFPFVKGVTPAAVPRQLEKSSRSLNVLLSDGTTGLSSSSVKLKVDGATVAVTPVSLGSGLWSVDSGVLAGLHLSAESHTAYLIFSDTGTYSRTQSWTFYNIQNLILPASPVTGENFDSYPEATNLASSAPPGWSLTNYTWLEVAPAAGIGVWNLTSQDNDPFVNFILVTTNTAATLEAAVLQNDTSQTINGIPVTTQWMAGNCLFAVSDGRARRVSIGGVNQPTNYAPQIQIVESASFNLSTVTNPVLTWSSSVRISGNGEEDALEYSVDNGATWLPGMIMFNANRLFLNPDGSYDAVETLTHYWTDVAAFPVVQDPTTRDFMSEGALGRRFGDVLKTPISAALSPYIVNRNDGAFARKVEAIRLPEASKKSQVRLRFNHYGSCGWQYGIDNIAFYDIAPRPRPVITSIVPSGPNVTITWINGGTLESATSLTSPTWVSTGDVSGSYTVVRTGVTKFYRVKQ